MISRESARPGSQVRFHILSLLFFISLLRQKVMSSTRNKVFTDEDNRQPRTYGGRKRAVAQEENKKVKEELLMSLYKRIERIEASQMEKEHYKGHEISVFGSLFFEQGKSMSKDALDLTPPGQVSLGVSPSAFFNVHQR